jgi:predicted Zn-dependent peptidase
LEPVAKPELDKAKQQLIAGLEMSLESNSSIADRLGLQMILLGRMKSTDEIIEGIESVTVADVRRVAGKMLAPDRLRFAIIAPNPESVAEHFKESIMVKEKK